MGLFLKDSGKSSTVANYLFVLGFIMALLLFTAFYMNKKFINETYNTENANLYDHLLLKA
jgi:hypothetical protein